jgi:hypothetical protein
VVPLGEGRFAVAGPLTMRGVTRQVTLPVEHLGSVRDPWGNTKAGFATRITLDRRDFGILWNAALDQGGALLGDAVEIENPARSPARGAQGCRGSLTPGGRVRPRSCATLPPALDAALGASHRARHPMTGRHERPAPATIGGSEVVAKGSGPVHRPASNLVRPGREQR